jgi:single-strand DNA-binding protein
MALKILEITMASYNRVVIVGNLTRDVELRYTPSGTAVTDIALAINDRVKKNDQWVDEVNFFDVTLWGRTAEVAGEYLSKGSSVLIEGKLKQDRWEQEGKTRSKVKIVGEKMQMLSSRNSGGAGERPSGPHTSTDATPQTEPAQSAPSQSAPPNDEVPF